MNKLKSTKQSKLIITNPHRKIHVKKCLLLGISWLMLIYSSCYAVQIWKITCFESVFPFVQIQTSGAWRLRKRCLNSVCSFASHLQTPSTQNKRSKKIHQLWKIIEHLGVRSNKKHPPNPQSSKISSNNMPGVRLNKNLWNLTLRNGVRYRISKKHLNPPKVLLKCLHMYRIEIYWKFIKRLDMIFFIYTYMINMDPPRGTNWMGKESIKQPLRVSTPPFGGCWYTCVSSQNR